MLLEAYSPLGSGTLVKDTLNVPEVQEIARALSITPAQVIISWHVQRGVSIGTFTLRSLPFLIAHTPDCRSSQERQPLAR